MDQSIINIALNSRDAMPNGGKISIETSNCTLPEKISAISESNSKNFVKLKISDNGCGMDDEALQKIYDPFFTTKPIDQGTGLGMAIVHGFVSQSKGIIRVASTPGAGTTVTMFLPLAEEHVKSIPPANVQQPEPNQRLTILVADDDSMIRTALSEVLAIAGHEVLSTENGDDIIRELNRNNRIDLILSDVVMPGLRGNDLYNAVKEKSPDTEIIFLSGYANDLVRSQENICQDVTVLQKPIAPDELFAAIFSIFNTRGNRDDPRSLSS